MNNGNLVISLDFELMWGIRDQKSTEKYIKNIEGVHVVIPRLLETFDRYKVRATFSTVGLLFFENKKNLINNVPSRTPTYRNANLSPYNGHFNLVGDNFQLDPCHYAPQLIKLILQYPEHEIGTHTFSHYYCLEEGQTVLDFRADLKSAIKAAQAYGITLTSLVFPRNQFNDQYLKACVDLGIKCYRGNEHSWLYMAKSGENESLVRRVFRLMDAYINISGHNCYSKEFMKSKFPIDIPASRFLRPYSKNTSFLNPLKLRRITSGMSYAAKKGLTYHLWWHPHNFGNQQQENFTFLESILDHYQYLHKKYNFESITMSGLAKRVINEKSESSIVGS